MDSRKFFHKPAKGPYAHFRLSPRLFMCDWAGDVGEMILIEGEKRDRYICSKCRQEVKYLGAEANVSPHNRPDHLGSDDRIELYHQGRNEAVLNYYHPLRTIYREAS